MYRELVEQHIGNRGKIVSVGEIFPAPTDHLRYCSLFMFDKEMLAYIKVNKNEKGLPSVQGYKGKTYCEAVWIDVDSTDLEQARQSAISVVRRLNADHGMNPDDLFIYFSGNKGFHIAIHNTFIGFQHDTPIEPERMKTFVLKLTDGIRHIDTVIYEPVRIFRIENSRHEKSGLYKLRISFWELETSIEDIKQLAAQPRVYPYKNPSHLTVKQSLKSLWYDSKAFIQEQKEYEHKGNLFQPPAEGSRNKTLLVQACTLFRKSELSTNAVFDIVYNAAYIASINAKEPVDKEEVKRIVSNAQRLVGDERKKPVEDELQMRSVGEWLPEWESYHLQQQGNKTFLFDDVNKLFKGNLRGKFGVVMGYGGSKKSLLALNIVDENTASDEVALYSNMEMSIPQFLDRVIDLRIEYPNYNSHHAIVDLLRRDVNAARGLLKSELIEQIKNKLQIIANGRMTYAGYKAAVRKVRETVGDPWCLIVDGLSMMGGKGTETERYSENSADLKQLANEENLFVLAICHISKGGEKWTRDLSRLIRGSEKILDNCDFYCTMSQIQEEGNNDAFRTDIGYLHLWDKRGSGKTVELVHEFDPHRLKLRDSGLEPSLFRDPISKRGKKVEADF